MSKYASEAVFNDVTSLGSRSLPPTSLSGNQLIILAHAYVSQVDRIEKNMWCPPEDTFDELVNLGFIEQEKGPGIYGCTAEGRHLISRALGIQELEFRENEDLLIVGYLIHDHFLCKNCSRKWLSTGTEGIPVHRVNVGIYSQVCFQCEELIVEGAKKTKNGQPLCLWS